MTVYTPRAAVRVFRLFPSVALQLAASVRGNRPSSLLFADGQRSRWTEVRFISGSSPCLFAFADSISRAPLFGDATSPEPRSGFVSSQNSAV